MPFEVVRRSRNRFKTSLGMTKGRHQARGIGPIGTVGRIVLGVIMLSPGIFGRFGLWEIVIAVVVVPLSILAVQQIRLIWTEEPIRAPGLMGFALNIALFLTLYLTPIYFPEFAFTSNLVLIFYGASLLLAAARGYAGCELTAISNWLLGRDDQIACVVFMPIDIVEAGFHAEK